MFGLTIEKLFLVALLAAVIIGPRRLPAVATRLAVLLGRATRAAKDAARRLEEETGASTMRADWRELDPRRYDPRRIIREAWDSGGADAGAEEAPEVEAPVPDASERDAPAGAWVVRGSSGHPRRVWVAAED